MSESLTNFIISQDFGERFAIIVNHILKNGELSLPEIVIGLKIPFSEIKHILIILIKHNIITFRNINSPQISSLKSDEIMDKNEDIRYKVSINDIFHRLRFPKFILHVKTHLGFAYQKILEEFLDNGRVSVKDCLSLFHEHNNTGDEKIVDEEILSYIGHLIKSNFLVQADSNVLKGSLEYMQDTEPSKIEIKIPKISKRKAATNIDDSKTKKSTKKAKTGESDANMLSSHGLTKEILARLGETTTLTYSNVLQGIDKKPGDDHNKKEIYNLKHPLFVDSTTGEEFIYKVNFRQFIHEIRTQMLVEIISKKINPQASLIIQTILSESKLIQRATKFKMTEPLGLNEIMQKLTHISALTEKIVLKYLEIFEKDGIAKRMPPKDLKVLTPSFAVNMESFLKILQIKHLEKYVESKYSQDHSRILRLLNHQGLLDEKMISEKCMLPLKEARSALLELVKDAIVISQEVPGEKGKHNYLYTFKEDSVIETIISSHYKVLFNLKKVQEKERMALTENINLGINEEKIKKIQAFIHKLESAALEVDDTLMLFTEF